MESDYDVFKAKMDSSCDFDIAKQLVREDPGKNIKVTSLSYAFGMMNGLKINHYNCRAYFHFEF